MKLEASELVAAAIADELAQRVGECNTEHKNDDAGGESTNSSLSSAEFSTSGSSSNKTPSGGSRRSSSSSGDGSTAGSCNADDADFFGISLEEEAEEEEEEVVLEDAHSVEEQQEDEDPSRTRRGSSSSSALPSSPEITNGEAGMGSAMQVTEEENVCQRRMFASSAGRMRLSQEVETAAEGHTEHNIWQVNDSSSESVASSCTPLSSDLEEDSSFEDELGEDSPLEDSRSMSSPSPSHHHDTGTAYDGNNQQPGHRRRWWVDITKGPTWSQLSPSSPSVIKLDEHYTLTEFVASLLSERLSNPTITKKRCEDEYNRRVLDKRAKSILIARRCEKSGESTMSSSQPIGDNVVAEDDVEEEGMKLPSYFQARSAMMQQGVMGGGLKAARIGMQEDSPKPYLINPEVSYHLALISTACCCSLATVHPHAALKISCSYCTCCSCLMMASPSQHHDGARRSVPIIPECCPKGLISTAESLLLFPLFRSISLRLYN